MSCTKFRDLAKMAPCSVSVHEESEKGSHIAGTFFLNPLRIEIYNKVNVDRQFAVLAHEIQHAKCYLDNCDCREELGVLSELHAYKAQIEICLNYKGPLKESVLQIEEIMSNKANKHRFPIHYAACEQIIRTGLWIKALTLI